MSARIASTSLPLPYAELREPRVGLLLWPSRRSVALILLAALAMAWLARRHAPWRFVADIPADLHQNLGSQTPFVPSVDGLITFDSVAGVHLIDLKTGRARNRILPSVDYESNFESIKLQLPLYFQVLNNGDRLAVLQPDSPTIRIYNTRTCGIDAELPNPIAGEFGSVLLSPDGTEAITHVPAFGGFTGSGGRLPLLSGPYDLSWAGQSSPSILIPRSTSGAARHSYSIWKYGPQNVPEVVGQSSRWGNAPMTFLAGNRRLLVYRGNESDVIDADSLNVLFTCGFVLRGPRGLPEDGIGGLAALTRTHYTLQSTVDGQVLDQADSTEGVIWSPDLSVRTVVYPPGAPFAMRLFDRKSGKLLRAIVEPMSQPIFFPTGGRFVSRASEGPYRQEGVYGTRFHQPLAILDNAGSVGEDSGVEVAGNGRSILIHRTVPGFSGYRLFRKTGWDCPESQFGVLAFPQTWLTIVLLVAASASLLADARLQAVHAPYRPPYEVVAPLFILCLLLTCLFAVEACIGRWIRTPAPLIVIACIGMARGSQAWRWIGVLILGGAAAWCGSRAVIVRSVRDDFYPLFDRVYGFPHAVRWALMAITTLALAAATLILARPSRAQ